MRFFGEYSRPPLVSAQERRQSPIVKGSLSTVELVVHVSRGGSGGADERFS